MNIKKLFERLRNWELWNFYVLYFPLGFVWIWYIIKSRAIWYFSPSNPSITFGGMEGEGKKEMYDQLPPQFVPRTIFIMHDLLFDEVKKKIEEAGFNYPFIVKPDIGMKGILFRKIENEEQLRKYHEKIPVEYIVQDLILLPVEVSVFYYRHPAADKGTGMRESYSRDCILTALSNNTRSGPLNWRVFSLLRKCANRTSVI